MPSLVPKELKDWIQDDLTGATDLDGTELLHLVKDNASISVTVNQLASQQITMAAAINISGHRIIASDGTGKATYPSPDDLELCRRTIGVSTNAVVADDNVIVRTSGQITEQSWDFDPTKGLFLGTDGVLQQTVPEAGAIVSIGRVISPTTIFISIEPPIAR